MPQDLLHILIDAGLAVLIALVGWLLNRAIGGLDTTMAKMGEQIAGVDMKVDGHGDRLTKLEAETSAASKAADQGRVMTSRMLDEHGRELSGVLTRLARLEERPSGEKRRR